MATGTSLLTQALKLAGNTSIASADALLWLNNFLQSEYRRKYPFQRLTATLSVTAGTVSYASAWDTKFLDVYEHQDGSCGRFADSAGNFTLLYAIPYRRYMNLKDRNVTEGQPKYIAPDPIGATWYIYPKPDTAYTVTVDYYQLPAAIAAGDTPLWSSHAPDELLVDAIKVRALEYMDDARAGPERIALFGDPARGIVGALPQYRRNALAKEGVTHQTALDQRVFLPQGVE